MIVSIDARKSPNNAKLIFEMETLKNLGISGRNINIMKATCNKPMPYIALTGEKLSVFSL